MRVNGAKNEVNGQKNKAAEASYLDAPAAFWFYGDGKVSFTPKMGVPQAKSVDLRQVGHGLGQCFFRVAMVVQLAGEIAVISPQVA